MLDDVDALWLEFKDKAKIGGSKICFPPFRSLALL
jgi:hypothetical protein